MDYLPQKAKKITPEDRLRKELDFQQLRKKLESSPVETTGELSEKLVKDLPVDRIDTRQALPLQKADDAMAKVASKLATKPPVEEYVYDAAKERAEYYAKMKAEKRASIAGGLAAAKKAAGGLASKAGKMGGSKAFAALAGPVGLALSAAQDAMASDDVGLGSDQVLSPEQEQSVEASRELTAGQPMNQARMIALQRMIGGK